MRSHIQQIHDWSFSRARNWDDVTSDFRTSHYYDAMRPDFLQTWAEEAAQVVVSMIPQDVSPVFAYRGLSGTAYAIALTQELWRNYSHRTFGMMYVRKERENSHGRNVEYTLQQRDHSAEKPAKYPSDYPMLDKTVLVFIDDHIDTGNTRDAVIERAVDFLVSTNKLPNMETEHIFQVMGSGYGIHYGYRDKLRQAFKPKPPEDNSIIDAIISGIITTKQMNQMNQLRAAFIDPVELLNDPTMEGVDLDDHDQPMDFDDFESLILKEA